MISKELLKLYMADILASHSRLTQESWIMGLITKLLEATHRQWLNRNFVIHDRIADLVATHNKEHLQLEIECK